MTPQIQQRAVPDRGWVQSARPWGRSGAARDASRHGLKKPGINSYLLEALK